MKINVAQCLGSFLLISENWIFNTLCNYTVTQNLIATSKFLECDFLLQNAHYLRSPLQPRLVSAQRPSGWRRWARALNNLTYPCYLRARLWSCRIDLVHCHFAHIGWQYRWLARFLHAPLVVSFYGWDYSRLGRSSTKWQARIQQLFAEADCFLCEGSYGASLLAAQGCPAEKLRIARLGVDVAHIPLAERIKRVGELRLVQVASFREKKGLPDTVDAFALALHTCPNMHLTLIGAAPGPTLNTVLAQIEAQELGERVTIRPGIPVSELHDELGRHHVFIHPSHHAPDGDCEGGAPVVLLDAQATGMPIISTTHCDIPQEVVDGITGMLCPEHDVAGLARAIASFYAMNQPDYDTFALAARRHVEQHFDVRVCAAGVEAIYQEIIAAHAKAKH